MKFEELTVIPTVQSSCSIISFGQNNLVFPTLNNTTVPELPLRIWTLHFNKDWKGTPSVLLHGICASAGLWELNVDAFVKSRPLYAIHLIGIQTFKDNSNDDHNIKLSIKY
jgi:hypothetical protein